MADEKRSPAPSLDVPDLDVPRSRPRPTSGAPPVAASQAQALFDDDDGLGMEIERDLGSPFQAPAPAAKPSGTGGFELEGSAARQGPARSGLQVGYDRLAPRVPAAPEGPSTRARALGPIAAIALAGSALAGLLRLAHRPAGIPPTDLLRMAFDGSSAVASGAVAITLLIAAIALGYVGVRTTNRSWLLVGAAALVLLLSLAMVTVTLAASGEHGPPPDGALLVPWLTPFALLLGGVDAVLRAARRFADEEGGARALALPVALGGGALLFLAIETSRFAALVPLAR